jgi:hypothetical protein
VSNDTFSPFRPSVAWARVGSFLTVWSQVDQDSAFSQPSSRVPGATAVTPAGAGVFLSTFRSSTVTRSGVTRTSRKW